MKPGLRLGMTLWDLVTSIEFHEAHNSWQVGYSGIGNIISKVCEAIIEEFEDEVLKTPRNADE